MPYKVKIYTYVEPDEEDIYYNKADAEAEAEQVNLMQPEGCENLAIVVECDRDGQEI